MEPTTLLLVASFLAPVPVTRQSIFASEHCLAFSAVQSAQASTQTVKAVHAFLATEFLATDIPSSVQTPIEKEIATYAQLQDDWDGEGGRAPSMETVISATLIAKFVPNESKAKAMVSSSGAVSLYWAELGGYAELGIEPDQHCYFFARDREGKETFIDALSVAEVASREWISAHLKEMEESVA